MFFNVRKHLFIFIIIIIFICTLTMHLSRFDLQFSHLLECISELTTISNIVPKITMDINIFQTFVQFLQIIGSQVIFIFVTIDVSQFS